MTIDPANHMLNANLAQVLLAGPEAIRDMKAADRDFTTALATDPLDTLVLELSGNVKIRLGDMDGAEKLLREAYRLNPDSYGANRGLGQVRDAQGDLAQARMHYEKAIASSPPTTSWLPTSLTSSCASPPSWCRKDSIGPSARRN